MDIKKLEHFMQNLSTIAAQCVESRQIARRLRSLLPARLSQIKQHHRTESATISASKKTRRALLDPKFHAHIDEALNMSEHAMRLRIYWETSLMLHKARQSRNSRRR